MTEIENEIVDLIKERNFEKDIAIMSVLALEGDEARCQKFLDWLKKNTDVTQEQVLGVLITLAPEQKIEFEEGE